MQNFLQADGDLYTLNMIYSKKTQSPSTIELQLDRKLNGLEGLIFNNMHSKFNVGGDINSYVIDSDVNDSFMMEVIKGLRLNGWKLLLSSSYIIPLDEENAVVTKFSFEKSSSS